MFHIPPGIIEQQLVPVLNLCKMLHPHTKIRKACFAVLRHFHNSKQTKICLKWKPQASDNLLLASHQHFLYFRCFCMSM